METTATVRSVGGLTFDVTIEERHNDKLEITSHPVQTGADISDHAYKLPQEVTIIVGKGALGDANAPRDVYEKVRELQESREPFDITTGKREYKNMLIRDISETTSADTENSLVLTLDCVEVILVDTQKVSVPASAQKNAPVTQSKQQGGEKQATNASGTAEGERVSVLAAGTKQGQRYNTGGSF
ncbi:hypothetical protein FACS1894187_07190 [Synergistales bacterium]|nr:hypothetical protein FACS1894187_07190 [Synergistales bacterium]